jgi:hypothetical protein
MNRFVGRKSDQRRAKENPSDVRRDQLIKRFGLDAIALADARIVRLLDFKIALDIEIAELLRAGAREFSVRRFAGLAGFTDKDMARDWPLMNVVKSIQEARQCVATLRPPKKTAATEANANAQVR